MLNLTSFTHWIGFNSSLFCDKIVYLDANANNWVKVFVDQLCLPSLTFSQLWIRLYRANWRAKQCSHTENCLSLRVWLFVCLPCSHLDQMFIWFMAHEDTHQPDSPNRWCSLWKENNSFSWACLYNRPKKMGWWRRSLQLTSSAILEMYFCSYIAMCRFSNFTLMTMYRCFFMQLKWNNWT